MLHAVIMAGGAGTRFWPESRRDWPKQLLALSGPETMLQATLARLEGLVPAERVIVATGSHLASAIRGQLPRLPAGAILAEPCKRDTAACIGLAAMKLLRRDPEAVMLVCPADHAITSKESFQEAVALATRLVLDAPGRLVTFGIRPSYPAETFGYIERGKRLEIKETEPAVYHVRRFHEKPAAAQARLYIDQGNFYWNSGIFVWRAATIRAALAQHEPELVAHLEVILAAEQQVDYEQVLQREFAAIRPVSIDYAVMERAQDVLVIEAPFAWDDVGSWQALSRLLGVDAAGNVVSGQHVGLTTTGSIIRGADNHLIVTLGVRDLIIVHTPDATLVANKHDEESIRQLTRLLEEKGLGRYL